MSAIGIIIFISVILIWFYTIEYKLRNKSIKNIIEGIFVGTVLSIVFIFVYEFTKLILVVIT